jgi:hypothetical protein
MKDSFAILRSDRTPNKWWDGYYSGAELAKEMAEWWTKELGVNCYAIKKEGGLPEGGYHDMCNDLSQGHRVKADDADEPSIDDGA